MRYPSTSPGRISGGGSDDGSSDDSGIDPTDPSDAPSASPPDQGIDPDDPRDAPSASPPSPAPDPEPPGRDPNDPSDAPSASPPSTAPDPEPAPSPTSRTSVDVDLPERASDGGPIGERIVSNLDELGQAYTDNVAEPVGDFTAATNPIAQAEQATLGTDTLAEVSEGVGEGAAQIGNVPGAIAGGIQAGQALADARARSRDQVTIGGVPTGVSVPNPEGQRENAQAAGTAAVSAAASAAQNPFETTGQVIGGAIGAGALSRGLRSTSRVADGDSAGSGASTSGTGGSVLDDLDVPGSETFDDFISDTRAQRQIGSQRDRGADTDTTTITADDLRDQLSAQDRARANDLPDRESDIDPADAYQRRRDERIRGDREVTDRMERDSAFQRFREQMDNREPDPILREGVEAESTGSASAGASGANVGAAGGLGTLAGVNDVTGVADTSSPAGSGRDPAQILGPGSDTIGDQTLDERNDPTGIAPGVRDQLGDGRLGGGTLPGDATGGGGGAGGGTDTGTLDTTNDPTNIAPGGGAPEGGSGLQPITAEITGTTTGSDLTATAPDASGADLFAPPGSDLGTTPATDTPGTGMAQPAPETFSAARSATTASDAARAGPFRGGGGGAGGGGSPRPRRDEEPEDEDDEVSLSELVAASDRFGSGIASAEDLLQ